MPPVDENPAQSSDVALFVAVTPTNGASRATASCTGRQYIAAGSRFAQDKLRTSGQVVMLAQAAADIAADPPAELVLIAG